LPVINPNPTGQAIRHNSTLDKNGGDSDNDYYGIIQKIFKKL